MAMIAGGRIVGQGAPESDLARNLAGRIWRAWCIARTLLEAKPRPLHQVISTRLIRRPARGPRAGR